MLEEEFLIQIKKDTSLALLLVKTT